MNINKLKGKITENGLSVEKLAGIIDIDRSSLYRKLNNGEKITIGEAKKMREALNLTAEEAAAIFFWLKSRIPRNNYKHGHLDNL